MDGVPTRSGTFDRSARPATAPHPVRGTGVPEDGIRLVSFLHYDFGQVDLEQRTLQPLDHPFGPRLSRMS
jgi:hypothetical protein